MRGMVAGMKLKEYLKLKGLKQKAFAAEAGVSEARISRIVRGQVEPGKDAIRKIVRATGGAVRIDDLWKVD